MDTLLSATHFNDTLFVALGETVEKLGLRYVFTLIGSLVRSNLLFTINHSSNQEFSQQYNKCVS